MDNFFKTISIFLIKLILILILLSIIWFVINTQFKKIADSLTQKAQPKQSMPIPEPMPAPLPVPNNQPEPPVIQPPQITKNTSSRRVGSICNSKKCIYQVEIVETTCYSATNTCEVTNKYKSTETEVLSNENKPD